MNGINPDDIKSYQLLNNDCLEVMKVIPDNFINLIFSDPPYDWSNSQTYNKLIEINSNIKSLPDEMKMQCNREFKRIIKPGHHIALFCGYLDKFKWKQYMENDGLKFKRELIWVYSNGPSIRTRTRNFTSSYESIIIMTKPDDDRKSVWTYHTKTPRDDFETRNWMKHKVINGFMKGQEDSPKEIIGTTPKPLKVCRRVSFPLTDENSLVMDPFMGTGSIGITSLQLKRRFLGIELNRNIFNFAQGRLLRFKHQRKIGDFIDG